MMLTDFLIQQEDLLFVGSNLTSVNNLLLETSQNLWQTLKKRGISFCQIKIKFAVKVRKTTGQENLLI